MYDHLLELSHRDHSNKWSILRFGEELTEKDSIEVNSTSLIRSPECGFSTARYQIERDTEKHTQKMILHLSSLKGMQKGQTYIKLLHF